MRLLVEYLAVGAAGFLGAAARLFVGQACGRLFGTTFPVGTFVINVSGSFLLGWFMAFAGDRLIVPETIRLAVAVGFIGAFTTYSTFMYESNALAEQGALIKAGLNVVASLVFGLAALRMGIYLASR